MVARTEPKHAESQNRGIVFTLDALFAALIIIAGLLIVFQIIPTSNSAAQSEFTEKQLQEDVDRLAEIALESGDMKEALLYWHDTESEWVDVTDPSENEYTTPPSGHPLEPYLNEMNQQGMGYRLTISYTDQNGDIIEETLFTQGTPGYDPAISRTAISLNDDDELIGPDSGTELSDADSYPAPDVFVSSNSYNVVTVTIVAWK